MTVNTTNITSGPYNGNDVADTFSYTFRIVDKSQVSVYETDNNGVQTLLTVDTDYTVAGIGDDNGGTITRVSDALPTNYQWFIRSNYQPTQLTAFSSQGAFFPELHEDAMDKLTFLIQQLLDGENRSFRLADSIDIDGVFTIAQDAATRAGLSLGFDDSGNLVTKTVFDSSTVVQEDLDKRYSVIFATVAAMVSVGPLDIAGNPVNINDGITVHTQGRLTTGDGGDAEYLVMTLAAYGSTPDEMGLAFTLDNGLVAVLQSNVTAKRFGAVGDGVTNDTAAIQSFYDAGSYNAYLGDEGDVYLVDTITASTATRVHSHGAQLKLRTNNTKLMSVTGNNVKQDGVIFDGNGLEVFQNLINVNASLTGWYFKNCTAQNITGVTGQDQYGIKVNVDDCVGKLENFTCKNISNFNPTPAPVSAFNGGILLFTTTNGPKDLHLDNIVLDNIWTDNIAGDINNSDSDGIRTAAASGIIGAPGLRMTNIFSTGVQKSAIKTSGLKGFQLDTLFVNGTRSDVPMIAGARFQEGAESVLSNIKLKGNMSRGINILGSNMVIDGLQYEPVDLGQDVMANGLITLQAQDTSLTRNIVISNVQAQNVTSWLEMSASGLTVDTAYLDISISNVRVNHRASGAGPSSVNRCDGLTLDNVHVRDSSDALPIAMDFNRCTDIKIRNSYFEYTSQPFEWQAAGIGVTDVELENVFCKLSDSAASDGSAEALVLRDDASGLLTNFRLNRVTVSVPGFDATTSQRIIDAGLISSKLIDTTMEIRSGGTAVPVLGLDGRFNNCTIDGLTLTDLGSHTGTLYAYTDGGSSDQNFISNVHSDYRGVNLAGGDSFAGNIAAFATALNNTGAGNTTGTVHTFT